MMGFCLFLVDFEFGLFLRGVGLGLRGWILEIFGIGFWGFLELRFGDFWN